MSDEHYVSQEDLKLVLRAELAEFKVSILDSLKELATKAELEVLTGRVTIIESHGSPQAQGLIETVTINTQRISVLENLKNKFIGALAILTAAIGVILPPFIQHYF